MSETRLSVYVYRIRPTMSNSSVFKSRLKVLRSAVTLKVFDDVKTVKLTGVPDISYFIYDLFPNSYFYTVRHNYWTPLVFNAFMAFEEIDKNYKI